MATNSRTFVSATNFFKNFFFNFSRIQAILSILSHTCCLKKIVALSKVPLPISCTFECATISCTAEVQAHYRYSKSILNVRHVLLFLSKTKSHLKKIFIETFYYSSSKKSCVKIYTFELYIIHYSKFYIAYCYPYLHHAITTFSIV